MLVNPEQQLGTASVPQAADNVRHCYVQASLPVGLRWQISPPGTAPLLQMPLHCVSKVHHSSLAALGVEQVVAAAGTTTT